ncbi:hypothetical protein RRG08_049445 [Elysia crispata]|uniref:Uncharacterized protein n=1 Tax=Elysia crispata TaxID=231223 RepID=A0AAE1DKW4_9GAST|nr:hypothetical protein RRG08_049445 [Elysia crispata]
MAIRLTEWSRHDGRKCYELVARDNKPTANTRLRRVAGKRKGKRVLNSVQADCGSLVVISCPLHTLPGSDFHLLASSTHSLQCCDPPALSRQFSLSAPSDCSPYLAGKCPRAISRLCPVTPGRSKHLRPGLNLLTNSLN